MPIEGTSRELNSNVRRASQTNRNGTKGSKFPTRAIPAHEYRDDRFAARPSRSLWKPKRDSKEIEKPQLKFAMEIDNSDAPFKPTLRSKPNAIKPLNIYLERDKDGTESYCHPYMHELEQFQIPPHQLQKTEPRLPADIHSPFMYVNDHKSLTRMISDLECASELAIDSEYHSIRSYHGFTCLLQISTRTKDYIIDTIALRDELQPLNVFFTNPRILKVLHNGVNDVIWLQKDLNLYLVNMFDTSLASSQLGIPRPGLGLLLKQFCNVEIDKNRKFQSFFDWRIRPLTEKAKQYARNDTHYLLYLHDILRNELIDKENGSLELLSKVYEYSTNVCKEKFRKPSTVRGHLTVLRKRKNKETPLDSRQFYALKSIYQWRDAIARETDESPGYVLTNNILLEIIETLPSNEKDILGCFGSNPISPLVRENLSHLHQLVMEARSQPLEEKKQVTAENKDKKKRRRHIRRGPKPEPGCSNNLTTAAS